MSTTSLPGDTSQRSTSTDVMESPLYTALSWVASLKITCVLFLFGMFIVFVGSLAQARKDVWLVVDQYFRCYVAQMDVADLFPPAMFPSMVNYDWNRLGGLRIINIPGGWTIGWAMLANLMAAHFLRFRIRATGGKLIAGVTTLSVGIILTWLVVWTGNQQTGVETGDTVLSPMTIWWLMMGVMGIAAVVPLAIAFLKEGTSLGERILLTSVGTILGSVLAYFLIGGESARLNLSAMRILWQLLKGTACALVMLNGCNLLFERRGGIVLLHIGVALLMFSELQVGLYAKENLLALQEGERKSFLRDVRQRELAIICREGNKDVVIAIPQEALLSAANADASSPGRVIRHKDLPFGIFVEEYLVNSALRPSLPGDEKTSKGLGRFAEAEPIDPVSGMDDSHDMSAVGVKLVDDKNFTIDSILCAQSVNEMRGEPLAETVRVDNKDYHFYLRFQRNYRDYEVELIDVDRENYVGSATPKDYRSEIVIRDKKAGTEETFTLWMNNPLRYRGETFYQSGYQELRDGSEMTTLSVVRNTGWMLPYIACMIVAVGMFAQFNLTLTRFLARLSGSSNSNDQDTEGSDSSSNLPAGIRNAAVRQPTPPEVGAEGLSSWGLMVPVILVSLSVGWLLSSRREPTADPNAMNLYEFAQLPVAWRGRPQPVDSFARSELLLMSHKSTFKGELTAAEIDSSEVREKLIDRILSSWDNVKREDLEGFHGEYEDWIAHVMKLTASGREGVEARMRDVMVARMPAVRWFLDTVARREAAARHRVIKIDNDQVLALLGLEKRAGLTYSIAEITPRLKDLEKINAEGLKKQRLKQDSRMTALERRVVNLFQNVGRMNSLSGIFAINQDEGLVPPLVESWRVLAALGRSPALMAVPTGIDEEERSWETMIASSVLSNVRIAMEKAGVQTREELEIYLREKLPYELSKRETVAKAVVENLEVLYSELAKTTEGEDAIAAAVKLRAASLSSQVSDPFLGSILEYIGRAPAGADADEIMAGVTEDDLRTAGAEQIASMSFGVFEELMKNSDKRLPAMRARLQSLEDESQLNEAINDELLKIVVSDLDKRAGGILFEDRALFDRSVGLMSGILAAWRENDVTGFNDNVEEYAAFMSSEEQPFLDMEVVSYEAFFNYYDPFMKAEYLYLPVLIMSFFSWIVAPRALRSGAFWLMAVAFILHTVALGGRMYISGRPPVTNLYSSAIFIGWAVVGAAFIVEPILKNGVGNIMGAAAGMGTLMIAHYLARDEGDTLGVMQAVLDTAFWLATHVVCITLGYAATFLAGAMGIAYCWMYMLKGKDTEELAGLGKVTYGVLCFAIFFSLVGTVLGGLWADDSWGRFWGWDPKENGAMLIVMWNAVILHARWDKMIRDYGTAVLAMFGNIVTAWSWFGVNELKAGLHTYGFTEGRLFALIVFIAVQAIIIAGAVIPVIGRKANDKVEPV